MSQKKVLLINGPNINLLGTREPQIYGSTTLEQIESSLHDLSRHLNIELQSFQSNHEGAIVDRIQAAYFEQPRVDAIILNPAAFTHTSVSIWDALSGVAIPFIELHISNVHARAKTEAEWRGHSYFTDKAMAIIAGTGTFGYEAALRYWAWKLRSVKEEGAGVS